MNTNKMSGKRRKLTSFVQPFEQYVLRSVVPNVPSWLETYHLTLLTVPFSLLVIGVGYLARMDRAWFLAISVLVFMQYVTDILDGAVGRYRETGLIKWGFYMDHLLDYFFACSVVASYAIAFRLSAEYLLVMLLVTSGAFIHEFLKCITLGEFNISGYYGFGPSEIRLIAILLNIFLIVLPKNFIISSLALLLPFSFAFFAWLIFRAQKHLWIQDMAHKDRSGKK